MGKVGGELANHGQPSALIHLIHHPFDPLQHPVECQGQLPYLPRGGKRKPGVQLPGSDVLGGPGEVSEGFCDPAEKKVEGKSGEEGQP